VVRYQITGDDGTLTAFLEGVCKTLTEALNNEKQNVPGHVSHPPFQCVFSIALGGGGIVTPGCEACGKRINTNSQYPRHLSEDVLPVILARAIKPNEAS
jgi:hypothetical protein